MSEGKRKPALLWRPTLTLWAIRLFLIAGILFVLAGMLLTSSGPGLHAAFTARARNYIGQIVVACQNYKIEYGALPSTSENSRLERILGGENPRAIPFLSLRASDLSKNGDMIDPWGTPFRITFDPDSKVHVISAGPDKIFGTADDITNQ